MATEEGKVVEQSPAEKKLEEAEGEVSVELPAPSGWKKKVVPKRGRTPGRGDVVFIAPSGEEIKTKRQLGQYLKSNPGGPASSEFDWSTGETPRRSVRITEKAKATVSPEDEPQKKKRSRKPASEKKKEDQEEKDTEAKDKEDDAEPMDEKKEEQEEKDTEAKEKEADAKSMDKNAGDTEMKDVEPVKEAGEAVNPAVMPDEKTEGKLDENNEAKSDEPVGPDATEVGPHEGSDAKPDKSAEADAAPLGSKENNGVKPAATEATPFENNIGTEPGLHEGFDVNGNNY